MSKIAKLCTLLLLLLPASYSHAQNFETCDRWTSWDVNGYTIYNNIWGDGHGDQCLWANNEGDWGVWANHPAGGGIKSYPNVDRDVSHTVSSMPDITASFNVTRPGNGSYNTAFDIWYNDYAYEIMLWMNWAGEMGPISYNYGCSGYPSTACPVATNVNVGGHTWNLFEGTNGSATVYTFMRTSHTNSGTVNIRSISQWLANNGYFSSNTHLHEIQFGFEITESSGGHEFEVNSYNVNTGSSSGSSSSGGITGVKQIRNRATSLYLDGMGRTNNGAAAGQWSNTNHQNAHWNITSAGSGYYYIQNQATDMRLDGYGRTNNGADCAQYYGTTHPNAQWQFIDAGSGYYYIQNRGTGLRLDGMGRTSNGANAGQWSNTNHQNAQWQLVD